MTRQVAAGQYRLELDGQRLIIRDGTGQIVETIDDISAVTEIRLPNGSVVQIGAIADAFADPSISEIQTAAGGSDAAGAQNSGAIFTPFATPVNLGGLTAVGVQGGTSLAYSVPVFPEGRTFASINGADVLSSSSETYAPTAQALALETDEDRALVAAGKATDPENDPLLYTLVDAPTHGKIEFQPDGTFTYRPDLNYNGHDSFTYRANDGGHDSNVATVSITVAPVNDAPLAADNAFTTAEDTTFGGAVQATDIEHDPLTYVIVDGPQHGSIQFDADGSFVYKPDADYNGTDSFTYRANDGSDDSNVAKIDITVTPVNDAPVADDAALVVDEDTTASGVTQGHDPEGDKLAYAVVDGPQHGALQFKADGSYAYTPDGDYNGTDSFTYRVNDGSDDSNVAKVAILVNPINDAPVAADGAIVTDEDKSAPGQTLATDIDSPALNYQVVASPAHGTIDFKSDGSFIYKPDADYNGQDSFTYRANDGAANSNVAKVDITVNPVNDAPMVTTTDGSVVTHIITHCDNLIVNGSFEDLNGQALATGAWDVYQNLPGWHTGRTENSKAPGVEVQHGTVIAAADGGNYVELDSDNFQGKAPTSTNATIYQDVKTTEGESYTLSFAYSPRVTTSGTHTNDVEVWWDGQKIATLSGDKQGWTTYTFEVEGGDNRSRLEFIGAGAADTLGGFIDSVSLHTAPSVDTEAVFHPAVQLSDIDSTMFSKVTIETAGFQSGDRLDVPADNHFTVTTVQHGNDISLEIVAKSGTADVGDFQAFLDGLNFVTKSDDAGARSITYTAVDDHGLASDPAVAHIAVSSAYDVFTSDLTASHTQLGGGNDTIHFDHALTTDLDAGSGYDTVKLEQANLSFGHADAAKLHNIEAIDATGHGDNTITLSASEVMSLSDGSNQLRVIGNAGDTLHLANEGVHQWQVTDTDADFTTLTFDNGIHQAVIVVSNELELLVA